MSKWVGTSRTGSGAEGILRGNPAEREREELLVFGYSCKLFRDDERAREVDQGRLLIPWQGDESLRIDRYDARGALHDLFPHEAPPGGYDWKLELTDTEKKVEQLCDEERYRALYCDEEEELMYKEEELKRLRAAGYGQIGFNYDTAEPSAPIKPGTTDTDEPFMPTPQMKALLPDNITLPETQKHAAIIEKTATFIAGQGAQMEILLRAKQAGNPQFDFLDKECLLHQYYQIVVDAVKNNKLKDKEEVEEKVQDPDNEHYLHPSLATNTHIEAAPSIPSIHYKPSADCDYTMLISRFKGTRPEESNEPAIHCGELAPPGTQPLALPGDHQPSAYYYDPTAHAQISRAPVLYTAQQPAEHQATPYIYPPLQPTSSVVIAPATTPASTPNTGTNSAPSKSMGLDLMHYYNSGSESEQSDEEAEPSSNEVVPPEDVRVVIEKMAAYVARNGDEFEQIVKAKNDPRFVFLDPDHQHYTYYKRQMLSKRGISIPPPAPAVKTSPKKKKEKERDEKKKTIAPVSFSIKKLKEPEPALPKPALPYESSDEENEEKDQHSETKTIENSFPNPLQMPVEQLKEPITYPIQMSKINKVVTATVEEKPQQAVSVLPNVVSVKVEEPEKKKSEQKTVEKTGKKEKKNKRERKENGATKKKKRDRSVSRSGDKKRSGSRERSKSRPEDDRSKKREMENTITISEIDEVMIDLTGDLSDSKVDAENGDRSKQDERKKRAAAFLASVGKDAISVHPPEVIQDNTLASAMVKTLVELRAKKDAEDERRRRRERQKRKRRKREEEKERSHRKSKKRKRGSSAEEDDYDDSSKRRRKHKKDKKTTKKKKRRRSASRSPGSSNHSDAADKPSEQERKSKPDIVVDPEVIKTKLKKLREESEDEFKAPLDSPEVLSKKEYSEGEIASSEDGSSDSTDTE